MSKRSKSQPIVLAADLRLIPVESVDIALHRRTKIYLVRMDDSEDLSWDIAESDGTTTSVTLERDVAGRELSQELADMGCTIEPAEYEDDGATIHRVVVPNARILELISAKYFAEPPSHSLQ